MGSLPRRRLKLTRGISKRTETTMKKLEYERPELTLIQLKNKLSLLLDFSLGGYTDDIEDEGDWDSILD